MQKLFWATLGFIGALHLPPGTPPPPSPAAYRAPTHGALLVVTKQTHHLAIVDGKSLEVLARVPIGEDPHEVAVAPDGKTAFISNYGEGTLHTLARVDLLHAQALSAFNTAPLVGPHGLWVEGGRLWFTAVSSEAVARLDGSSQHLDTVLGVGQQNPHMLWVSHDGRKLLTTNAGSASVTIFDQEKVGPAVVPGSPAPPASYTHIEWHPTVLPVGAKAEGFAISPDEREAWIGNDDGTISVLDLVHRKEAARFQAGITGANRLRWVRGSNRVLVTTHRGKDLIVIDARTRAVLKRVPIEERGASAIQLDPEETRAFIACPRDHFVAVVDLNTLTRVATIDVGREPDGMTWWNP